MSDTLDLDKYIAEKSGVAQNGMRIQTNAEPSFDLDKYLAEKTGAATGAPGLAQTALEHGANATSLGYLPQLQALAAKPIYAVLNQSTGRSGDNEIKPDSYVDERDQNIRRLEAEQKANPKTALAGTIGGAVVGGLATPGMGVAKGVGGAIMRGAAYGGALGALSNPGDVEGEVHPYQLKDRAANAAKGAAVGGLVGGATEGTRRGLMAIGNAGESLQNTAETQAFKSSGAMLKDFRQAMGKDEVNKLGRFMLDEGMTGAGSTVKDVAEKSEQVLGESGKSLESIYKKAVSAIDPETAKQMPGLNPVRDKKAILEAIEKDMGDSTNVQTALKKVGKYLDQLGSKYGDKTLDPKTANDVKGFMDEAINYARNPAAKKPGTEAGFSAARKFVAQKIEQGVRFLGEKAGDPDLANELKTQNARYGMSKQINGIARDKLARESANKMVSLTDTIAGGAGGAVGAGTGALLGHDAKSETEGAIIGGLLAGAANHGLSKYGPGMVAGGANALAKPLSYAAPVGYGALAVPPNGLMTRSAIGLLNKPGLIKSEKKKSEPPAERTLSGGE